MWNFYVSEGLNYQTFGGLGASRLLFLGGGNNRTHKIRPNLQFDIKFSSWKLLGDLEQLAYLPPF